MVEAPYSWSEVRKGLDKIMLIVVVVLLALGIAAIYSAGSGVRKATTVNALKQLIWGGVSAVVYVAILKIGYKNFLKYAYHIYAMIIVVLVVVLALGSVTRGAQSWFRLGFISFQPAELGKVALALALARFCSRYRPESLKNIFLALCVGGISTVLVLLQPDLGSALVYCTMIFMILIVAGMPGKYTVGLIVSGLTALPFFWSHLKVYQKMRLLVFLDPYADPQGAGYNVIQSRIAVGSGGLWGKGFLHGTQGRLHFLPEPHTDFIFSVFSEEFGFVGGVAAIILFAILFWKLLTVTFRTKDIRAKLLAVGITAWLWFQVMECIAMSMGLAPVTGIPLPLFSYGGSSLLMEAVGLALIQSVAVSNTRERFL